MSQRVIGYEGEGRQRRPVYADEGAASVRVDGVAALGVLSASQVRGSLAVSGGAGPVERREITAAEIDARRVVEARPSPIAPRPAPAPRPQPKEEPAVVDTAHDVTAESPIEALAAARGDDGPWDGLAVLADAVLEAIEAQTARAEAETRWLQARVALDAAYRALGIPTVVELAVLPPNNLTSTNDVNPTPIGGGPVRSRSGEGQRTGQASARDRRAAAVMSAMGRLDDNMDAVAAELGMRKNAVAQVVKHARLRAAAPA